MSQPPPNVTRADQLRKGQIRGRIRTGARSATKEQEKEYLDRFRRLAQDPSPLVPSWKGAKGDPFQRLRTRLGRVHKAQGKPFWLKWHGRGQRLENAYAHTLLVLHRGKIVSFAHLKFRGRDVNYVLRGSGLRDKLLALHNFHQDDVRLLGYLDVARRRNVVLISIDDTFQGQDPGQRIDPALLRRILARAGLDVRQDTRPGTDRLVCAHLQHGRPGVEYTLQDLDARVALCRACLERVDGRLENRIEAHVLSPRGHLKVQHEVVGSEFTIHPDTAKEAFEGLIKDASNDAQTRAKEFNDVTAVDRIGWAEEALQKRLDDRPEGFLLAGRDLWLGDWDAAADEYGATDLERRALRAAFRLQTPRIRAAEPTLNKLLEDAWPRMAADIVRELGATDLEASAVDDMARQRPSDALAELDRVLITEERFAAFPRFERLDPRVRLAHDLFKAHRTGNTTFFNRRVQEGIKDESMRALALALARAFGQSASVEWQVAPHEKDQAVFWEPYARALARSEPDTYTENLTRLAEALQAPAPRERGGPAAPDSSAAGAAP